jgi:hypothetical protein
VVRVGRSVLRVHRRIEKLERAFSPSDRTPPVVFKIRYVDSGGRVTSTLLLGPNGKREWIDGEVTEQNRKEASEESQD